LPILKSPAIKRAVLPRAADYTKSWSKDWERLSRSGRYDLARLKAAMLTLIANDAPSDRNGLTTH
jgi:mRNA interferase YafQ